MLSRYLVGVDMEHTAEIEVIKKELRTTQDSVLLIHSDLKQMSGGIAEMASSMKIMVEVQSDLRLMNERIESRHLAQKEINSLIHARIDATNKILKDKSEVVEKEARNGQFAYDVIKWIGITVGGILTASAVGAWLWVIAHTTPAN